MLTTANRGATIEFATTFFDIHGAMTQPYGAIINVTYLDSDGAEQSQELKMSGPSESGEWIALLDTRGIGPCTLFYEVHTVSFNDAPPLPSMRVG